MRGVRSSPPCHTIGTAAFHISIAVCATGLSCLFVGAKCVGFRLHTDIQKKALLHSDCPSVYRLSVFHVCGTLSTQRKGTGTVTVFSTLLSYKVTESQTENAEKGDYCISASTTVCFLPAFQLRAVGLCEFPMKSHFGALLRRDEQNDKWRQCLVTRQMP